MVSRVILIYYNCIFANFQFLFVHVFITCRTIIKINVGIYFVMRPDKRANSLYAGFRIKTAIDIDYFSGF